MSWSRAKSLGIWVAFLTLGLGGCGFTPLYGDLGAKGSAAGKLAGVAVAPVYGPRETSLAMREMLLEQISGARETVNPTHTLIVNLTTSEGSILVQPDSYATRYNVSVGAKYQLIDMTTSEVVTGGQVYSTSAYNVVDSEYATLVGKRDAERRAADVLAHDISMRLAVYFAHGTGAKEAPKAPAAGLPKPNDSGLPSAINPSGAALPGTPGMTGDSLTR